MRDRGVETLVEIFVNIMGDRAVETLVEIFFINKLDLLTIIIA